MKQILLAAGYNEQDILLYIEFQRNIDELEHLEVNLPQE